MHLFISIVLDLKSLSGNVAIVPKKNMDFFVTLVLILPRIARKNITIDTKQVRYNPATKSVPMMVQHETVCSFIAVDRF